MAQQRNSSKLLYWLIATVAVLVIILLIARAQGLIGSPKALEVELARAERTLVIEKVSASGTVQPVTEVKLAPEVSGEIRELNVQENDSVKRGDLLVKIRPDTWLSQLERAEAALSQQQANLISSQASLARAQATYKRAELAYERQKKLWNNGDDPVISKADWQIAEESFHVAESDLKAAKQAVEAAGYVVRSSQASVNEARENVSLTSVTAPMGGIVSKLNVKQGERVVGTQTMAGTEMMRIADLNVMEVRVDVNENDIMRVHQGDTAIIDVDAYSSKDKKFKGVVTLIANTAKEKVSTDAITEFEVRILVLQSSYQDLIAEGNQFPFRPGMTASVEIMTERKANVLSVPLAAVTTRGPDDDKEEKVGGDEEEQRTTANTQGRKQDDEKEVVFVNQGGVAKQVEVKTGISDYDNIEITEGITDTTEVVIGPFLVVSKRLKDGDHIRPAEKKEK